MGLTKIAITRPVFILMLMLAAMFMGALSYQSMRKEQNPDVSFGMITVTTVYPGAGPEEVNNLVTRRIEDAVSGVNGLRELTSTSLEGVSTVMAQLDLGIDQDVALNEVRSKVDTILNELPSDVERPTISKFDTGSEPVIYLSLNASKLNGQQLRDLAEDRIVDRFARVPGVAGVSAQGGDVRELQVQVSKEKLTAYGIGIRDLQRALQSATLNVPSGKVTTGREEYNVRVLGEFRQVDDLREMLLSISDPKNPMARSATVRLADVAKIEDTVQERTTYSRLNGQDAITVVVLKAKDGDTVSISKGVQGIAKELETEYRDDDLHFVVVSDQSKIIKESLADLNLALFFGIFLVAVIVFVFLHNLRGTIIVAIAIPTCIFATFIALKLMGFTVNNMSMLALALAVGVLVDDAIVIIENIYRHLRRGESPKEAALKGRAEIGLAAIAITLADVVVFLPIAFMSGIVGEFMRPLGVGFVCAVLFSLFVSFTVTPMLASRWYRAGEDMEHPKGRFAQWFERGFGRFENGYRRALDWSLNHRWFVFILGNLSLVAIILMLVGAQTNAETGMKAGMTMLVVALIVGALIFIIQALFMKRIRPQLVLYAGLFGLIFPASSMAGVAYRNWKKEDVFKFQFFPMSDSGLIAASIELPPGSNLQATEEVVRYVEEKMMAHPDVHFVLSSVGTSGASGFQVGSSGSNFAQVRATLYDKVALLDQLMPWKKHEEKLRSRDAEKVAFDLLQAVGRVAGAKITISSTDAIGFGAAIQMSFSSDNREQLVKTVTRIYEGFQRGEVEGVINPNITSKPGKPEIRAIPDRRRLADAGLTPADLAQSMRMLYSGDDSTKFRTPDGREYDIRVMLDRKERDDLNALRTVPITFVQGDPIFLGQIAKLEDGTSLDKIDRRNRQEEVRIEAGLLPGKAAGTVQREINAWIEREQLLSESVTMVPLGQAQAQSDNGMQMIGALFIGLMLVYMLLASLYDNLLYPFIIQLAQPQAMVGALLALVITDKALNLVGFIGIIALVGLVGKNAILLVDYTNTLRERGKDRHDALVEAGPTRLRPIVMTTLALIFGMLPVALAVGRGSEFRETIGITIIGGIILSTLLTLLVIPCSYTIFDDLSIGIGKLFRRGRSNDPEPPLPLGDEDEEPGGERHNSHPAPI